MVTESTDASPLLGLSNNLADAVEKAGRSIVAVDARRHTPASGVHWRQGIIVTADHIIEREDGIKVTGPDGRTVPASVAGRDSSTDLAVLRVEGLDLAPADIASDSSLKVGHIVLAVARPGNAGVSASMGAISALGGPWRTWSGGQVDQLVRPDLTMYPGFSGGPLVNAQGQVAGINTSGLSRAMSLTIPASTVNRVVDHLLTRGHVSRGYLGLGMQRLPLPDSLKRSLQLPADEGLIVVSVETGGPADKAGMLVGDILVTLDGRPSRSTDDVQAALDPERVGKQITAGVVRGGVRTDIQLTVGERPVRGE